MPRRCCMHALIYACMSYTKLSQPACNIAHHYAICPPPSRNIARNSQVFSAVWTCAGGAAAAGTRRKRPSPTPTWRSQYNPFAIRACNTLGRHRGSQVCGGLFGLMTSHLQRPWHALWTSTMYPTCPPHTSMGRSSSPSPQQDTADSAMPAWS